MSGTDVECDLELLARYARDGSEDAFAEIVRRHLDVVHAAALRQVRSEQLAKEVAQSTFMKLATEARRLRPDTVLVAWLYQVARCEAVDVVRREVRRQQREQVATEMNFLNARTAADQWTQIEPMLDEAMQSLGEMDRAAILLRYFEKKPLRTVGETLGATENGARKRVNRAVERLRRFFGKRGVTIGATGLAGLISTHAAQAAPVGLAVTISTSAALFKGTGAAVSSTIFGLGKTAAIQSMTAIQKTLVSTAIAAALGTGIYEARRVAQLQSQAEALQQQDTALSEENKQLREERNQAAGKLAAAQRTSARGDQAELQRLRAEVTRLREESRELAQLKAASAATGNDSVIEATLRSWATRAAQLKERLAQMPEKSIPELQLLTEKNWFDAIKDAKGLETDADFREAMHKLRDGAKNAFGEMTREALKKYAEANNGLLPEDLSQLKPFFETPVDDAVLQRYALQQKGKLSEIPGNEYIFAEKAPLVDEDYDSSFEFGMNGTKSSSVRDPGDIVWQSLVQFARAHDGLISRDPSQLTPYLKRPLEKEKMNEILSSIPPGITTMEQLKAAGPK